MIAPLDQLAETLRAKYPDAHVAVDRPRYLDFVQSDGKTDGTGKICDVVVEYRDNHFGITANREPVPFESADEFYPDLESVTARVLEIIEKPEATKERI